MQIEQALFTSAQTARAQGYHLVARSPGIDGHLAQQLSIWAPSQNALIDRSLEAESLNVFPVDDRRLALTRTVYAGAEYSDRGEFRLETNILVMERSALEGYAFNPLDVIRAALASGYLRLRARLPAVLERLGLPSMLGTLSEESLIESEGSRSVDTVVTMSSDERVVIVGCPSPIDFLHQVFRRLPEQRRLDLSFSTGLKPSIHRPFRIQFLPAVNDELTRELSARGMKCLTA